MNSRTRPLVPQDLSIVPRIKHTRALLRNQIYRYAAMAEYYDVRCQIYIQISY
jgi:hypothetical protein